MNNRSVLITSLLVFSLLIFCQDRAHGDGTRDVNGQWYGAWWNANDEYVSETISVSVTETFGTGTAVVYVPYFDLFHMSFPLTIVGDVITIGNPASLGFVGIIDGDTMEGDCWQQSSVVATWSVAKFTGELTVPGPAPGPECENLPSMYCFGGNGAYCAEVIPFEPVEGQGYINYPYDGETWDDQIYSFLRRDFVQLIKYATAKVECKTANWDYGNFAPLGLGDMSEEDGSTPGTNIGELRHPPGTHEYGKDIDTAYYQLYSPDNLIRSVGVHFDGQNNEHHLLEEPYALDCWRTALYIAYLSEHPNLRAIGVDGRIGLVLEETLDELVTLGWIDQELRASIPLFYEIEDNGFGWFLYHYNHLHISINGEVSEVPAQEVSAAAIQLLGCYPNPFNPITTITFSLAQSQPVKLSIHDAAGRLVHQLANGEIFSAGVHKVPWNGRNDRGGFVSSGVYFLRLEAGAGLEHEKLVLLK